MGIAVGDYQNNGLLDLYNTTFSDDYNPLYRNDGDANFTDISYQMGIAEPTIPFLGWGTAFLDYDNDGWKDLIVVNGHVYPHGRQQAWGTTWAQRPLLFHNINGKKFELVPAVEGTGLAIVSSGRGLAVGDLFNDGKLDVVINVLDGHPVLLRNVNPDTHHWIELKLVGGPKSPRDAVGATVYLTAGGMRQRGDVSREAATPQPTTPASTSASATPPPSTTSRFTGPAAPSKSSPSPNPTRSSL